MLQIIWILNMSVIVTEWLWFNAKWENLQLCSPRTYYILMRWWCLLCTRPEHCIVFFCIVLDHWNNSAHISSIQHVQSQSAFNSYSLMILNREIAITSFIEFDSTLLGIEPTSFCIVTIIPHRWSNKICLHIFYLIIRITMVYFFVCCIDITEYNHMTEEKKKFIFSVNDQIVFSS